METALKSLQIILLIFSATGLAALAHSLLKKEGGENTEFSDMKRTKFITRECRRRSGGTQSFQASLAKAQINLLNSSSLIGECHVNTDWSRELFSERGAFRTVGPVRNQGTCGACWAIAAVAATEAIIRLKFIDQQHLQPLSVQQVLDYSFGRGCRGGTELDAYSYMIQNKGLASEKHYPYRGWSSDCDERRIWVYDGGRIRGVVLVSPPTELELRRILCFHPVTAAIASDSWDFQHYTGGIFDGLCGEEVDLTVLVVGFGEENGVRYWKIQNSWGVSWGEEGYMRMSFEAGERCKIFSQASYPLVKYSDNER